MQVTFKGQAIDVQGKPLQVGDRIPEVELKNGQGELVNLTNLLAGKVTILSVVPNILTRTCELQTKRFDEESQNQAFQFYTVSRNSVDEFNQWNRDNGLEVATLSDTSHDFGDKFGIQITLGDAELLTRAVYIVDSDLTIKYVDYVAEVSEEPDYDKALQGAKDLQA